MAAKREQVPAAEGHTWAHAEPGRRGCQGRQAVRPQRQLLRLWGPDTGLGARSGQCTSPHKPLSLQMGVRPEELGSQAQDKPGAGQGHPSGGTTVGVATGLLSGFPTSSGQAGAESAL